MNCLASRKTNSSWNLVRVEVVHDDNPHFTAKADGPDICGVEIVDEFAIHGVLFFEDTHVKVLEVNLSGELLRTPSLLCLRAAIKILEVHVIAEAADDVEAKFLNTRNEDLHGEVGISDYEIADGQKLFAYT